MTRKRKIGWTILIVLAVALAAGAAYALTYGAHLAVKIPRVTVAGRRIGGETIGFTIPGLRRGVAVAALVNEDPIYWNEVDLEVDRAALQYNVNLSGAEGQKQRAQLNEVVLDQLIDQRLILQTGRKRGVEVPETAIASELDRIMKNFGSEEEFQTALARRKLTLADVRRLVRLNLTLQGLIPHVAAVTVSEAELQRLFAERRAQYDQQEQVRVSHILIRVDAPTDDERARQTITLVRGRLAKGEKFADLARQYSEDPGSKDRGGDLDFVRKGALVPEFEKVAFALKPGEISQAVKTQYGYHLILLHERKAAHQATFAEAQAKLREQVVEERQEAAFQKWLAAERKRATIQRHARPAS